MLIEQAVFTSARTNRAEGYQLVASSTGVTDEDARALSAWGPSHDSLLEDGVDAVSVNFHRLPSGAYCVSKTEPAGGEYSGRRGHQIYTQCLLTPPELLARYANNPFALLTAAFAQGSLRMCEELPRELEPFRLPGRAAAVDQSVFLQLQSDPGPAWTARILSVVLSGQPLALVGHTQAARLVAGLFNCLPPGCRAELSFSTGLKYSTRRPFRIVCAPPHQPEQRRLLRQHDFEVLDLGAERTPELTVTRGFPGLVSCALAAGKTSWFASRIGRSEITDLASLDSKGDELLDELAQQEPLCDTAACTDTTPIRRGSPTMARSTSMEPASEPNVESVHDRRADAAHRPRTAERTTALGELADAPADTLGPAHPVLQELLETLDDTVFEAIAGKQEAHERLARLWRRATAHFGAESLEVSREQYLRYALRMWHECIEGDQLRNPAIAVRAMDVLAVLFRE